MTEQKISLGGNDYSLKLGFDELADIETRCGAGCIVVTRRFLNADQGGTSDATMRDTVAVIGAGIKGAGGEAPKNLGELLRGYGIVRAMSVAGTLLVTTVVGEESVAK